MRMCVKVPIYNIFMHLFLHLYEPHTPWEPPEPWRSAAPHPYDGEIAVRHLEDVHFPTAHGKLDECLHPQPARVETASHFFL